MSLVEDPVAKTTTGGWSLAGDSAEIAGLTRRPAVVQLDGVTYLIGGADNAMVLSSADGLTWATVTGANLPVRMNPAAATLDGTLYVSGGAMKLNTGGWYESNDVFASTDGYSWTQARAPDWSGRLLHSMVAYQGRLWVFGGMSWDGVRQWTDVWSWSGRPEDAWRREADGPFLPRNNAAAFCYGDQLVLIGGNRVTGVFLGDGWYLLPGGSWQSMVPGPPGGPRTCGNVGILGDTVYLGGGVSDQRGHLAGDYIFNGADWVPVAGFTPWRGNSVCTVKAGALVALTPGLSQIYRYTPA